MANVKSSFLYFLSAIPCALKFNGEYVGTVGENYSVFPQKKGLYEFIPLKSGFCQLCFLWDEKPLDKRENVRIIDLYGGFLIIPKFQRQIFSNFKELFFKTVEFPEFDVEIQVYSENGVKLTVKQGKVKATESVPFTPAALDLEKAYFGGIAYLVAFLSDKKTAVFGFEITGDSIKPVLKRECVGYESKNDKIVLTETKNDVLRHTVVSVWSFSNGAKLERADIYRGKEPFALHEKLLPYAFFEEILLGKDVSDFLAPKLRPRADDLKSFAGDFSAILPPPHFKPDSFITLIYNDRAEYADLGFSGRLIDNITITVNGN